MRDKAGEDASERDDQKDLDLIERLYAMLIADDVDGFLDLCADDVVFEYPAAGLLPYGGVWHGRSEVRRFFAVHDDSEEILAFEPGQMTGKDGTVVVRGFFEGRAKPGERVWSTRFVHVLDVADGRLKRWEAVFDTAAAVEAHREAGPR